MNLYKLTDQNMKTYDDCQWTIGVKRVAPGAGPLCSGAYLHAYTDPLLAVLLNPIHADFAQPRLFLAEGAVEKTDRGLKVGCTELTITEELPPPPISMTQRVAFGILAAKAVYTNPDWTRWADAWLDGSDRTTLAARAARWAAAEAAEWAAMEAAEAATGEWAAEAARWAAKACTPGRTLDLVMIAASAMCLPIRD